MIDAMRRSIGSNDMMAYLVMMAIRLVDCHWVLKPTGWLYLHCDPTASHYLKTVLDADFGPQRLMSEISGNARAPILTRDRGGAITGASETCCSSIR